MSAIPFLTRGLNPAPPLKAPLTSPLRGLRTRSSKACKLPAFPTPTPGAAVGSTSVVVARVLQRRQIGGSGGSGGSGGTTGSAGTGGSGGAGGTGGSTARYTLTISLDVVIVMPTGGGAPKPGPVTSVPTGITCGGSFISGSNNGDCEESYTNGTSVVLTAQGNGVTNFTAWTGDCSGTNPVITVVMDKARNCKATFTQITN